MSTLLTHYRKDVAPALQKHFGIGNVMSIPKITKITVNVGIGKMLKDGKAIEKAQRDLALMTGQKAVARKAKKSIASFKIREGMDVGLSVTMRGQRMYDFLQRLITIALPASKDFRGIDTKNFDKQGNLNFGIKEHNIFPEITYETLKDIFSIQVTITTTAKNREEGIELVRRMGFPLKKD
jgi:large subunit ribosomal protein L5